MFFFRFLSVPLTLSAVGVPGNVQSCATDFTCEQTCGPLNDPSSTNFVIYDLGSVQTLSYIELKVKQDVGLKVRAFTVDHDYLCYDYTLEGAPSNVETEHITNGCYGKKAKFIRVETSAVGSTLDLCYLRYHLLGIDYFVCHSL